MAKWQMDEALAAELLAGLEAAQGVPGGGPVGVARFLEMPKAGTGGGDGVRPHGTRGRGVEMASVPTGRGDGGRIWRPSLRDAGPAGGYGDRPYGMPGRRADMEFASEGVRQWRAGMESIPADAELRLNGTDAETEEAGGHGSASRGEPFGARPAAEGQRAALESIPTGAHEWRAGMQSVPVGAELRPYEAAAVSRFFERDARRYG